MIMKEIFNVLDF